MWGKVSRSIATAIGLLMIVSTVTAQSNSDYREILHRGDEAVQNGNIEKGLTLWESAAAGPSEQLTDPRIGISYIETVTRERLTDRYAQATEMYYWGLSNPFHPTYEDELKREIERLKPIADVEEYRHWKDLLDDGKLRTLGESITGFWESMDPTLDTRFNERLVEHWKRIAYAKENFRLSNSTVYGTDERAMVYLKYGEPSRIRDGVIDLNISQIMNWINDSSRSGFAPDPAVASTGDSLQVARNVAKKIMEVRQMLNKIKLFHRYPRYEVWV
ncbi:MAG: GWxTD domain-containing protein, partial [Balneolaceae bacterium]|nr:GWxTD domain-containing protein [Balneolaceae bacterium]